MSRSISTQTSQRIAKNKVDQIDLQSMEGKKTKDEKNVCRPLLSIEKSVTWLQ